MVIATLAFAIRMALMLYLSTYYISAEDNYWPFGWETGRVAQALAEGRGFSSPLKEPTGPTAWLAPIYPCVLALLFKLFGVYSTSAAVAAITLNSLLSAFTCVLLFFLGRSLLGSHVGLLAAGLLAVYPPSFWHAINTIWDTTLFVFALMGLLLYLYTTPPHPTWGRCVGVGVLAGIILLINPGVVPFYPVALLWTGSQLRVTQFKKLGQVSLIVACTWMVILPWMVRNYVALHYFTIKSCSGLDLKIGNNMMAWETYRTRDWELVHPSITPEEFRRYAEMTETPYLKRCEAEAMEFIRQNPDKFRQLIARRVAYFWFGELGEVNEWTGSVHAGGHLSWFKRLCYWVPLPFFLLGAIAAARRGQPIGLLLLFLVSFPLAYYITHVTNRYRYPIEPILLLLGAYGVWVVFERIIGHYRPVAGMRRLRDSSR